MLGGSIPTGGILAQMFECVHALRVMHLQIRHRRITPLWARTWVDFPTVRTHNPLANESVRTVGNTISSSANRFRQEGPLIPNDRSAIYGRPMGHRGQPAANPGDALSGP